MTQSRGWPIPRTTPADTLVQRLTTSEPDNGRMMFSDARALARKILELADRKGLCLATAESCTGGLLATLLTDVPGVSHCFECGFVVYSDDSKSQLLGIPRDLIEQHGAVSRAIACEMACRALANSNAHAALAVTGFAGPAGEADEEGLVFIAVVTSSGHLDHEEHHFGPIGRDGVRDLTAMNGLSLLLKTLS